MSEVNARIQVEIFGSTYSLRGGADPASVRALANDLDARMRDLAGNAPGADPLKVAVLAALRLADEVRELRGQVQGSESRVTERIKGLSGRLAHALAPLSLADGEAALDGGLPLG